MDIISILTDSQYRDIENKVAGHKDAHWTISSHIIGHKANVELHNRIKQYLKNNFKQEYYKFDFYCKEAQDNVVGVLSEYDELSYAIDIVRADKLDFDDIMIEDITGKLNVTNIRIKIYEKFFCLIILEKR